MDLEANGGTPPYEFEITQGNLPAGLNFDSNGKISGTAESPGTSTGHFKVTDSAGDDLTQAMKVYVIDFNRECRERGCCNGLVDY